MVARNRSSSYTFRSRRIAHEEQGRHYRCLSTDKPQGNVWECTLRETITPPRLVEPFRADLGTHAFYRRSTALLDNILGAQRLAIVRHPPSMHVGLLGMTRGAEAVHLYSRQNFRMVSRVYAKSITI